jgi:isoprenylcysteine carboxyl methyltransferase (ICMT) family protein YpbQ
LIQRFEELDRAIDNARDILRTTLGHSYGEYMASLASLEVLECEREQLSSNAFCPYCPHCQFARQRLAELDRAIDRARQSLQTTGAYSYGEYRAGFATLEALELEREQLRLGAFYWHYQ